MTTKLSEALADMHTEVRLAVERHLRQRALAAGDRASDVMNAETDLGGDLGGAGNEKFHGEGVGGRFQDFTTS